MNVKDAVAEAKTYVKDLFAEDGVTDVRLEEVEYDEREKAWNITLGFLRRPSAKEAHSIAVNDILAVSGGLTATLDAISARRRVYRVVRVREGDGAVLSVKHRDLSADAA